MLRKIIKIDENKCNGCGACAAACHEGAIEMVGGVARLTREDYCDGLGDCLPSCPTDAISFEFREAPEYDEAAVTAAKAAKNEAKACSCPSSAAKILAHPNAGCPGTMAKAIKRNAPTADMGVPQRISSRLAQWPCQIKLVPPNAPYFDGARLLIAADCTAYAYGSFHEDMMKGHITLIGCPKLDEGDYAEKLLQIIRVNNIKSIKLARMEVPCCGGLENALKRAIAASGKLIPWQVITVTTDGKIME